MSAYHQNQRWMRGMKWSMHLQEGCLNLFSTKLRSMLALLGILVGTASVVAMVSGGELATNEALKQFKTLGTDLMAITIMDAADSKQNDTLNNLSLNQANSIVTVDKNILAVAPYTQIFGSMQFQSHELNGGMLGVTESFMQVAHIEMAQGRFISDLDRYAFYAVIGDGLYQQIKNITVTDPIGQQIQVGKNILTIVGVAKPWPENSFVYANVDNAVMLPLLTSTILSQSAIINSLVLQLKENAPTLQVQQHIQTHLQSILAHKTFYFRDAKELISRMTKQNEILTVFLGLIGSVSLLVGGIGVMNIMLVSVIERRREIGIRLAVGATRTDIRLLFLTEALMLSCVGGIIGVLIGIFITYVIALIWHWQFIFCLLPAALGFLVSVATGIFFGFYPAHKAALLDPIEALRL